jgi:GH25 family lysozyme M1 (1,4-beta-N-acetylmuramidase)
MSRLDGIDISHWQGEYNPTPNPPRPVDFVIVKFSEGNAPALSAFELWDGARKAKNAEGYHYWRTAASLQDQIDAFLIAAEDKDVDSVWLDWEQYNNTLTKLQYERAYEWIVAMQAIFQKVGLYTNATNWNQMNAWGDWHKKVPFWYARYIYFPLDPMTYNPPLPLQCDGWDTWQYGICLTYGNTDNGQAYGVQSKTLDVNVRISQQTPPVSDISATLARAIENINLALDDLADIQETL